MAKERLVAFNEDGWRQYQSFIRNQQREASVKRRDFRRRWPILQGGGDCDCPEMWQIELFGDILSGDIVLDVTINAVTEAITLDFNFDATDIQTEFLTHSEIASAGTFSVEVGPFPASAVNVYSENAIFMALNSNNLTPVVSGSAAFPKLRRFT